MPKSVTDLTVLAELLEEYRPRLLAVVRRRLDPLLAARISPEDVLTEAFLQARRRWAQFEEHPDVTAYAFLYRVVRDCLIETWRRETRDCRHPGRDLPWPEESSMQLGLGLVGRGTSPSEAAVREDLRRRVRQTLDLLSDNDREVLWMRHYDELSFPELAAVLDVSEDAARLRHVRALKRLQRLWQRLYPSEEA